MTDSILITGGTGSFGNAFVERALKEQTSGTLVTSRYHRIVIYSRGEHRQEEMAQKFGHDERLRFFIGDVRDHQRLEMAMHGIDTVVHAAAMKIVPTAEYNPTECIATNITGAENVIRAAIRCGVRKVLALSTDKAVNPINLYGATKLCAEKVFVAANSLSAGSCAFSVMRYGNVVGSNGSVVPAFLRMIAAGKPLTITDKRMTRFWITMDRAIDFSFKCLDMMQRGEIFVPKIPSIRIADLAEAMSPGNRFHTGIRPGEKLHESLISTDEGRLVREFEDHYRIVPEITPRMIPMPEGWSYHSDDNEFLTIDQIRETIL
jgi:UDP-N-acetylglucosamine 4,6-dehydratase